VKPLLLLIDLQRDYLGAAGLDPPAGAVVERAGTLLSACRERGVPVVHVWTTVSRSDDRRMPHWKREDRWLCEEGTAGHAPPPELEPEQGELVLHKTFFRAFEGEDLERVLRAERADPVLLAGVHLHGCVRQAVLDAYQRHRGDLWVAEDATTSDDPVHSVISRRYLERRAARFLSVAGILAGLRGAPPPSENGDAAGRAAGRCRNALPAWQRTEVGERAAALERLAERLEPEAARLADAMAVGIGKPVSYGSLEVGAHRGDAARGRPPRMRGDWRRGVRQGRDPPPAGRGGSRGDPLEQPDLHTARQDRTRSRTAMRSSGSRPPPHRTSRSAWPACSTGCR
jgi:nicotinamidase-related amidase